MSQGFVHLHVHSEYSLLDGACRIKQLVSRTKELGQTAVAITDHGCMYGVIEFYNECLKQGVKPIIGCEVYVAPRTRFDKIYKLDTSPYHLVLLCKDNTGYQNLIKLVSIGHVEGFYNKPRVDVELLERYSEGLIALSGCLAGEIARELVDGDYETAKGLAIKYNKIFGQDNFYIEVQNHGIPEQQRILPYQYKLSRETGIPLAATNDAHYISKDDSKMQQVLIAIQTNTTIDAPNSMFFSTSEFYVKSTDEMMELFKSAPKSVSNTCDIAGRCNVSFEFGVIKLPSFSKIGVVDNIDYFKQLCKSGMDKIYGINPPKHITERLNYELGVIISMGYVDYFLIVWDFIRFAKENSIPVGPGRGSGAGSIAAYCMGITGIDPIKYNLLFERFLNPERISMPDFDIDFCYEGRQRVIDYVVEKYGSDRVAQIITFGTMAAKAAIRDVGRALGVSYQKVDTVAKLIPFSLHITLEKALLEVKELKQVCESDPSIRELLDMAKKVEGMPRHASTHAAGVVITSGAVSEFVPVQKNDDVIVTQYSMTVLESLGLLKMDFLGLRTLTLIRDCEQSICKRTPNFRVENIPIDDKLVYEMMSKGLSQGVFQFESAGMKQVLTRLMPETLEDLIAIIALYRPGPMDSIPKYIVNRHNPSLVDYKAPQLKEILDVTYGCMVYQEQVMQICRTLAGYSYGRADLVRRAMSKKKVDVMESERKSFIYGEVNADGTVNCVGAVKNGVSEAAANAIFDEMTGFASYAFNKSHAAAYAYLSYQTAYLKCHYYKEYMAALLTSVLDNTAKVIEYISECESGGIKLLNPSINESFEGFTPTDTGIRFGLRAVKNLGVGVINDILSERNKSGAFTSLQEFCKRMIDKDVNKRAMESLIKCGAFDEFKLNRRQMLENYDKIFSNLLDGLSQNIEGQLNFFAVSTVTNTKSRVVDLGEIDVPFCVDYPLEQLLEMEKETVGIYISGHPISPYLPYVKLRRFHTISEILESSREHLKGFLEGDKLTIVAMVQSKKPYTTRNGSHMCFLSVADTTGEIEGIVFQNIFEESRGMLVENTVLELFCHLSIKDDEDVKLIVDKVSRGSDFLLTCSKMDLYIKTDSMLKDCNDCLLAALTELGGDGSSKVCFYFQNINRLTRPKELPEIIVSRELIKRLCEIAGEENIALK